MLAGAIKTTKKGYLKATLMDGGTAKFAVEYIAFAELWNVTRVGLTIENTPVGRVSRRGDDDYRLTMYSLRTSPTGTPAGQLVFTDHETAIAWLIRLYLASPEEAKVLRVWQDYGPPASPVTEALTHHKITMIKNLRMFGYSLKQAKHMLESLLPVADTMGELPESTWASYDFDSLKRKDR